MPLSESYKAAAFATLVPSVASAVGTVVHMRDPDIMNWYKDLNKPWWAFQGDDSLTMKAELAHLAMIVPTAYATYRIWKLGGGPSNSAVRCALASYFGVWTGVAVSSAVVHKRSLKMSTYTVSALFGFSLWLAYKYSLIDTKASLLTLPLIASFGYASLGYYRVWAMNDDD